MPKRKTKLKSQPRCYLAKGQAWPDGRLKRRAPAEAVLAQQIARTFKRAVEALGHTHRQAAKKAGISPTNVQSLLSGKDWSSLRTLASVESSYSIKLWVNQQGSLKPRPCAYLDKGHVWPDGNLEVNAPPEAVLAKEISRRFREACEVRYLDPDNARGFDPAKAAAATKIAQTTVEDLLDGRIWCDLPTVARIEGSLDIPLWVSQRGRTKLYR